MEEYLYMAGVFCVALFILATIALKILKWLEGGGLYYRKHPAAKVMDSAKRSGNHITPEQALNEVEATKKGSE